MVLMILFIIKITFIDYLILIFSLLDIFKSNKRRHKNGNLKHKNRRFNKFGFKYYRGASLL